MENADQKKQSPHTKKLNVGDRVRYVLDVGPGPMERIGTVLLLDGRHCVVRLDGGALVWLALRAS